MSIPLPDKFEITEDKRNPKLGTVVLEPCFPGYGVTIGNAIRRVLLSSLEGAAVTSVKIKDAQHEFSTMPNVKEDILEIILNLKKLRFKVFTDEPVKLELKVKGEKETTAADIGKNNDVEIVNQDLKIATLTSRNAELSMELTVEKGLGYTSADQREEKTEEKEIGNIAIDSVFTPIVNVALNIENVRVGQMTNYEKLILNIETDGTIAIKDAVEKSAKILIDHFGLFMGEEGDETKSKFKKKEEKDAEGEEK